MVKNDYFTIVYYILKYLYECLKTGEKPCENILNLEQYPVKLEDSYILYIYKNLFDGGYIIDLDIVNIPRLGTKENLMYIRDYENIKITPLGIEYLIENSTMQKAYEIMKDFAEILPWNI